MKKFVLKSCFFVSLPSDPLTVSKAIDDQFRKAPWFKTIRKSLKKKIYQINRTSERKKSSHSLDITGPCSGPQ